MGTTAAAAVAPVGVLVPDTAPPKADDEIKHSVSSGADQSGDAADPAAAKLSVKHEERPTDVKAAKVLAPVTLLSFANEAERSAAVKRQVEYYFSDTNLPRDRFLRAKMAENEKGWVDIDVLLTFNKLRSMEATVARLKEAVAGSELVEVESDGDRVRRLTPVPETPEWRLRALYAKGWVATDPEPDPAVVEKMFAPYGKVVSVRARRWSDENGKKNFKGSVFVEFERPEEMERAVADNHVIQVQAKDGSGLEDKTLIVHDVETYFELKREEAKERTRKFKERKAARKAAAAAGGSNGGAAAVEPEKKEFVKGLIMKFTGVGEGVSREDIKELIEPHSEVAWIDFERGSDAGFVRFAVEDGAVAAVNAITGKELGGKAPELSVLRDEEETAYWNKVWEQQSKTRQKKRGRDGGHGHGGNKRFRGGGGRGRGRGGGRRRDT